MRLIYGVLTGVILAMVFWHNYKESKDFFHPLCFFAILQFLRYVPTMISGDVDTAVVITEDGVFLFMIMEIISVACVCLGFRLKIKIGPDKKASDVIGLYNSHLLLFGIVFFSIGVLTRLIFIVQKGGIQYILSNIVHKVDLVTGSGYLLTFGNFMTYGICFILSYLAQRKQSRHPLLIIAPFLAIDIFLFAFMSDRTAVMRSLMMIFMVYHYQCKRFTLRSLLKPQFMVGIACVVLFIVAMPLLRTKEGFDAYGSLSALLSDAVLEVGNLFYWFSYAGRDIFIYQNYNWNNYWFGTNIINFLCAIIPASIWSGKPPVDEGYYLSNAIAGYEISPPSNNYIYKSSYPFSNQGIMYTNFGLVGLIVGSILLGIVYRYAFDNLKSSRYNVVLIIIMQVILYNFSFTSHDMVNVLSLCRYLLIPLFIFGGYRFRNHVVRTKCENES